VETSERSTQLTPRHTAGFAQRLEKVLCFYEVSEYGKLSVLARLTGMTPGGARLFFTQDRPPKRKEKFDLIVEGLLTLSSTETGRVTDKQKLQDYLLFGGDSPFAVSSINDMVPNDDALVSTEDHYRNVMARADQAQEEKREYFVPGIDPIFLGKVYVCVNNIANENRINVFEDLGPGVLKSIVERVIRLCPQNTIEFDCARTHELVKSAILLGRADLL